MYKKYNCLCKNNSEGHPERSEGSPCIGTSTKTEVIILENAVESTTSVYCTDYSNVFDYFFLKSYHPYGEVKNHQKHSNNQHISPPRYDSTAFSRIIGKNKLVAGFIQKYNMDRLVDFEVCSGIFVAIKRKK